MLVHAGDRGLSGDADLRGYLYRLPVDEDVEVDVEVHSVASMLSSGRPAALTAAGT
jgi:hypothetical protein